VLIADLSWWALLESNQRPPPCEGLHVVSRALTLSSAIAVRAIFAGIFTNTNVTVGYRR
jgi:hypothetical protein